MKVRATYEGSRSIVGPYLAQLGASGTAVGIIAGLGELLGYALRVVSGRVAEKTGAFWPITLFGYAIQMISVPLLALAGSWPVAALLIVAERIGRATRNPPRDVMLSHAGKVIGFGWAFGLNEALDQTGAMIGPLSVAAVLAAHGQYKTAFAMLLIPALITLTLLAAARLIYPSPEDMETDTPNLATGSLPRHFLDLSGRGGAGRRRLPRFLDDVLPFWQDGYRVRDLDSRLLCNGNGVKRPWLPRFRQAFRPEGPCHSHPFDRSDEPVCAAGVSGRLLGRDGGLRPVGGGHGRS